MNLNVINESSYPTDILNQLCYHALHAMRIKAGDRKILIVIHKASGYSIRGMYSPRIFAYDSNRSGEYEFSNTGLIEIWPHGRNARFDSERKASKFWGVLLHEIAHLKDNLDGKRGSDYHKHWKNRPHEKRAVRMTDNCLKRLEAQSRGKKVDKLLKELSENLGEK